MNKKNKIDQLYMNKKIKLNKIFILIQCNLCN